ncbi:MAG: hypothetical protein RLZZ505_527 [Verrucomicrobiota bacterium]|jgi:hypothetical protein
MSRIFPGLILLASASAVAPEYFAIGFAHILPYGLDHILFLLALFFLTQKPSDLLIQLTLFTLAHSLSMGLSLYGMVDAPGFIVEVAIALSITFVAAENLFWQKLSPWRPWIVFASGLVHGLGFAHSFGDRTFEKGDFLPALFGFNMGIEAGQIVVIGIAYALVAVWWKRENYRRMIARPASLLIAASGLCWAAERLIR